MQTDENLSESTQRSLSVLTPDCIKSFIEKIETSQDSEVESRKVNLSHTLKNIKNHIINTPSAIQAESLLVILETLRETFLAASSESIYYKIAEICFLIDSSLPDSQLDSHDSALNLMLEMSNHSFFFNTLLLCIENYYKKIAAFDNFSQSETMENLTISFYSTSIEILTQKSPTRYQQCKSFIIKNLDSFKAAFFTYLQDRSIFTQKRMEKIFSLVLNLLKNFVKEPEMNSFSSIFMISVLSEITGDFESYLGFSSILVNFLLETVTEENYNELLCLPPLFSEPLIISLSSPVFQQSWFLLWDLAYKTIPKPEIFESVSQVFSKFVNRIYQQGLNIFLRKCDVLYKDVIEVVNKPEFIRKILMKIEKRVSNPQSVEIYSDTVELIGKYFVDGQTFSLLLNEKLMENEICQNKIGKIIKETLNKCNESQIDHFLSFLQSTKSLSSAKFLIRCLVDKSYKETTEKLLTKNLSEVLISILEKDFEREKNEEIVESWQNFFSIFYICEYQKKIFTYKLAMQIISILRKSRYDSIRRNIIENSVEMLEKILRYRKINKKFLLISFDVVSYPYNGLKIDAFRPEVLKVVKFSKFGYDKTDYIVSIVIFHLKHQLNNEVYLKILKKGLSLNASPGNVVSLLSHALDPNPNKTEKILKIVEESLSPMQKSLKFWHFPGTGPEIYTFKDNIKLSNKLTICIRVSPSKNTQESVLLDIQGDQSFRLTLKILHKKVSIQLTHNDSQLILQNDFEISHKPLNFIAISILGGKNSIISLLVNSKIICKLAENLKILTKIKKFSIAGSLGQTHFFSGKFSALVILKEFLHEDTLQLLNQKFYFDLTDELRTMKEKIIFLLSSKQKSLIKTLDPEKKQSYCFIGKTLEKNIKYASCILFSLISKELTGTSLNSLLKIFINLCKSEENPTKSLIKCFFSYSKPQISSCSKYFKLVLSIKDAKLRKECIHLLLLNEFNFPLPQKTLKIFLNSYKAMFRFSVFNFLMLKNLAKKMTESEICENFSMFADCFCEHNTTTEILATLAQLKDFPLIEGLLNILINVDFKDCPETLFKVFMQILVFLQFNNSFTLVCIIIFNYFLKASNEIHWNTFKKDSNKTRSQELDKYLLCLKDRVLEIESILNAVLYLASKNVHFTEKSNIVNLFDIVLSQISSINSDSIPKFFKFLQHFVRFFHSAVLKSQFFLTSFSSLSNCFHVKAGEILVYICSELKKFKTFNKIVEFFRNVKHKSYSFHIFASLFSVLYNKIVEDNLLLAEVMTILSFFSVDKENSEAYCEIVIKFAGIIEKDPRKLKFTAVYYETNAEINENCVGNIFLTIAFQAFHSIPSILFENCKNLVNLPEVDFFSKLKLEKVNEDYSILFCFIKISSLTIQGSQAFSAFLEKFKEKTRVLDRIEEFINNLSQEKIEKFYYLPSENQDSIHFLYDKEKSFELIRKAKQETLSKILVTEDWVQYIHILLQSFIVTPFDILLSTPKEIVNKANSKNSRTSSLEYSSILAIHGKQESFLVRLEYLKHLVRKEKKSRKFEFFENVEKNTFFVANFHDSHFRMSKVKLKEKPETEYEMRRRQYKTSLIRSRSTVDFTSVVFTEQGNNSFLPGIKESLCKSENFYAEIEQITVRGSFFGKLLISGNILQIKFEGKLKPANSGGALEFTMRKKSSTLILYSREISEILPRKFIHKKTAIEIFTHSGKSFFINFFQDSIQSEALTSLKKCKNFHIIEDPTELLQNLRKKWVEGQISNFHYLMLINKYSGRSFNDISQYPVFPWVITNFHSTDLNLSKAENFRDFSYPIAAQTAEQRKELSKRVRYKNASTFDDHQNGSHYSNGGIVLYYLFRIEPYTQQAILLHDGGFDNADRIFYSMEESWKSCIMLNDSKELVPELFYLSEAVENLNGLDAGNNHLGKNSASFVVPMWAKNSCDFVRKHCRALESGICSKELHKWIDLVFGYKQRGTLARENFNLFMKVTYDDLFQEEKKSIQDNIEGITDQIYHFGQTPAQLFTQAHPKKKQHQPDHTLFTFQKQSENKLLLPIKNQVQQILATDDFLLIFYKSELNFSFTRHKIGKKLSEKGKIITLKGITGKNPSQIKFYLWKNYIVSSGYPDYKIRIHDFLGEFLTLINTSSIQPSAIMSKNKLFYADFNIIISIKDSWKLDQKYYGHIDQVISLTVSESYSILCSLSELGKVLVHDLKSAEIIYKFDSRFCSIHATEYGNLVGVWEGGYSLVGVRGNCISCVNVKDLKNFVVSRTGESMLYSNGREVLCRDLFDDSEKVVKEFGASVIVLSESNKIFACICDGTHQLPAEITNPSQHTKLFLYIAK